MLSDRCLYCPVCLSVTLVYCGQTVGWVKMTLGMEVGLGPSHIVLDGDQLSPKKGVQQPPNFGPCVLWPNSCMGHVEIARTWSQTGSKPNSVTLSWSQTGPKLVADLLALC